MRVPEAPLFNDPIYNGAADPTIIWNHLEKQWWIVYTQRRANSFGHGVANVHGSDLGVASSPDGHNWLYRGTLEGLEFEPGRNTWWAPDILFHEGLYHMYVSYVQGMPTTWERPRSIIHYTSEDLWHWKMESILELDSERIIDACVAKIPSGVWRMWYKDENDESFSHYADSTDLYHWEHKGRCITYDHHEGPNVFWLEGLWWYIGDCWRGQGVFRSEDCENWEFAGYILDKGGNRPNDSSMGNHADVLIQNGKGYIFYFSHSVKEKQRVEGTSVQVALLHRQGDTLICDRDEEFDFELLPPDKTEEGFFS